MIVSLILLLVAYVYYNNVKKIPEKKKFAKKLVIAAWVLVAIELVFAVFALQSHSNKLVVVAFPVWTFFQPREQPISFTYRGKSDNTSTGGGIPN